MFPLVVVSAADVAKQLTVMLLTDQNIPAVLNVGFRLEAPESLVIGTQWRVS